MTNPEHLWIAIALTVFAGLATGIGSFSIFFSGSRKPGFLAAALGFSAGVMIYVSFMEIMPQAKTELVGLYGADRGTLFTVLAFFGGIIFIGLIDKIVPSYENPHELKNTVPSSDNAATGEKLLRMGLFAAAAIAIHNFPEGLATFMAAMQDPKTGSGIAVAIAIHNIPEGIAVAVPIYQATGNRRKAFTLSFLSGIAEPVGAIIGYFVIRQLFGTDFLGFVFAAVAGIMVYISLDELLPTAEEYGEHHLAIYGLIAGMAVMALSLILLG